MKTNLTPLTSLPAVGANEPGEPNLSVTHAFAVSKQRFTLGMPEGSRKTLVDLWEPGLVLRWSTQKLLDEDCFKFSLVKPSEELKIVPNLPTGWQRSYRRIANAPILAMEYQGPEGRLLLEAVGGIEADIVKMTLRSAEGKPFGLGIVIESPNAQIVHDIGLLRMDKSLFCAAVGQFTVEKCHPLGTNNFSIEITLSATKDPHVVWLAIPHHGSVQDTTVYNERKCSEAWDQGVQAWQQLLGRAPRFMIPDQAVADAYHSCLADQFILREPVRGGIGFLCGTDIYRCVNAFETDAHVQAMLGAGYFEEAWRATEIFPPVQNANGCWTDYTPWNTRFWYANGNMSLMYETLYRFTHDKKRMADIYPRLIRLARWCEGERAKSKSLPQEDPRYGLMPPGDGDGGLENDLPDAKNVFFPHNAGNVMGLRITAELAKELGTPEEAAELQRAFQDAHQCLLRSMERCAVAFPGGRRVPASVVPGGRGSMWLCAGFAYPGRLVPYDHPLVSGTLGWFESLQSQAGIPINIGWQRRGLWPGGAIECPAPVYLRRDEVDRLSRLIYAGLNCGSPVWTWPEERESNAGTSVTSGDLQEAWFPVNFCRLVRDCLLYEDDSVLHLAAGVPRFWHGLGKTIGVTDAPTHFGKVSYGMQCDVENRRITGTVRFPESSPMKRADLYLHLPGGLRAVSVSAESGANLSAASDRLRWENPHGEHRFEVRLERQ